MKFWVCVFLALSMPVFSSIRAPLFPEDGSQRIYSWFYTNSEKNKSYAEEGSFDAIEQAFARHGVTIFGVDKNFAWLQDILFFDQKGNHLLLKDPGHGEKFYEGLTGGVFTYEGPGFFDLQKFTADDMPLAYVKSIPLKYSLFEGGGLISGKFKNSETYAIVTFERFQSVKRFIESVENRKVKFQEAKRLVAKDLGILAKNLFVMPAEASSRHLDLYIKALPGGVLLMDSDEDTKQDYLEKLYSDTKEKGLLKFLDYYRTKRDYFLQNNLRHAKNFLSKFFEIHTLMGEFKQLKQDIFYTSVEESVNFFNAVSGIDPDGRAFFITNKAVGAKMLELQFAKSIEAFGFEEANVHFVGNYYLGSAGIDCFGVPSPVKIR